MQRVPVILMLVAAGAMFVTGYLPNRRKTRAFRSELTAARRRIGQYRTRAQRLRQKCAALRAGDPEALDEAFREVLRKGHPGEFIPSTPEMPERW